MIVKNECATIRRSLTSVSPLVDEIIVVDTGSTDGTQDICREFEKVKIFEPEPIMFMTKEEDGFDRIDFAANRNIAQEYASGDWIFILDGDEKVVQTDGLHHHVEKLEELGIDNAAVDITSDDKGGLGNFLQIRLHKKDKSIRWIRPVHNTLEVGKETGRIPLEIFTSYKKEDRSAEKEDRAEPMLLKASRKFSEETWPAYYLAGMYLSRRELEKSKLWSRRALIDPKDTRVARAWYFLVHATLMSEGLDEAEKLLYQALSLHPHYPDLNWLRTVYALARWEVCINMQESMAYSMHPQKTYQIDREVIAKALHVPWPFVKARTVEEPSNGEQPVVRT
jgi:glycosyltransferase involved in cell wall biosynthesis